MSKTCTTHHHACDCREKAFLEALALAQDTMEAWASGADLHEWHCRVENLTGCAYPKRLIDDEQAPTEP